MFNAFGLQRKGLNSQQSTNVDRCTSTRWCACVRLSQSCSTAVYTGILALWINMKLSVLFTIQTQHMYYFVRAECKSQLYCIVKHGNKVISCVKSTTPNAWVTAERQSIKINASAYTKVEQTDKWYRVASFASYYRQCAVIFSSEQAALRRYNNLCLKFIPETFPPHSLSPPAELQASVMCCHFTSSTSKLWLIYVWNPHS